ncbi:MAG: hypothetical protein A2Y23_05510 [Clostridiales bacterium GWB2_37_7]|nr:MAG: hypothetical protein A2Y23_05510 [Clostridiales bacterium GWB2_37_7]
MNIEWNIETFILLGGAGISFIASMFVMKISWKQYGILYITAAIIGEILDIVFVKLDLFYYPYKLFHNMPISPYTLVMTIFPFYVIFGVRYSPMPWKYKFPFYMTIIHLGMTGEVLAQYFTKVIEYGEHWDTWDSYIWWWLFILGFELVGGLIVSKEYRTPISEDVFKYGNLGWYITQFIFTATVFLGGVLLGTKI